MEAWLREMPHVAKETEKQTSNQKERWEENGTGERGGRKVLILKVTRSFHSKDA